jgi:glycosyltransferase involved in cell wall biosynthesis
LRASAADPAGLIVRRVPFLPTSRGGLAKLADHLVVAGASVGPAVFGGPAPDVVVASLPSVPSLAPALASARRWRVPLVLDMRDSWPDLIAETGMLPPGPARWLTRLVTAGQRQADAIVTVPPAFAGSLVARGYPAERIVHIRNGIDVTAVPVLDRPPLARDRLRVLYLGTLGVSQGLDSVVEALGRLGPDRVEARFIGLGTEREALRAQAVRRGTSISFEEPVTGEGLWDAYRWADTCLVPLRDWPSFRDAVPSKLYEIMACGRHVTACLAGEAAGVIDQAGAGLRVEPGDPAALAERLDHLADHRDELDVGPGPRAWVAEHADAGALADRYLELLERVVAGRWP